MLYEVITGVNDDGEALLGDNDLTGQSIEDAISDTVELLVDTGYITDEDTNEIVIAVNDGSEEKSEELATDLQTARITSYNVCYTKLLRHFQD